MRILAFIFLSLAGGACLCAQDPLNSPAPLAPAPALASPAQDALTRQAAQRAQELGFPTVAAELYGQLLAELARYPSLPRYDAAERSGLTLALATALLDDNRPDEAERVLGGYGGARGSAWHLREGLAAARLGKTNAAASELAAVKAGELAPSDRAWDFFLRGMLAGAAGDPVRAGDLYEQAGRAATTDLERARFSLEREKVRLLTGPMSERTAEQTRQNAVRFQGTGTGYDFFRSYAVMLDALGRKADAVKVLQDELLLLPPQEKLRADDFRLLLGLVAGAAEGEGRRALMQLLETGGDPDRRRMALQLLATASLRGPGHAVFRAELGTLIAGSSPDPILGDLLLFRAEWALGDGDNAGAEDDAHALIEKFPGSALTGYAWSVLTGSAWEQRRYRTAADDAFQARAALPAGEARAELGVVVAEAWYRAGDFPGAADAYAAALHEPPAIVLPGNLMFQLVKAEIEAGEAQIAAGKADRNDPLKDARTELDLLAANPAFDPVDRWEAEWNFASALQQAGQTAMAYGRLNRLLVPPGGRGAAPPGLPPELRARMAWLQARLSLDAGQPRETLVLVDAMAASLDGIDPGLRTDIASTGELLKARACFALGQEAAGLAILEKLRADFPQSDAAVESYLVAADHDVEQDKIVEAQGLLTKLADDFPARSDYAPYALLRAALLAERLGQQKNLEEADKLIESLVTKYPDSPLVFDARLKEGDLLRKLNDFPKAEQVYESLRNNFPRNPEVIYAELALAECHNAQSASDPSHTETESAISLFADLRDRVDAPVDMRVEAGFNLGYIDEQRGDLEQARQIWWRDVVSAFLLDPAQAGEIGAKGRYWMTRTLIELGELDERQGKLGEAIRAWRLVVSAGLPGADIAREQLARLNAPPRP